MIVRDPKDHEYMGIGCDEPNCSEMSPPAKVILENHGLVNMGWDCRGGTHYCPAHNRLITVDIGDEYVE